MSVKVIAQVNPFTTERKEYNLEPCKIKDILKIIDSSESVNTGWRVMVNDEITNDYELTVKNGDRIYIKVIPEGGDTKNTGKGMTWAGAAMIIAGAILSFTGYGAAFGVALIGAGVGCVAGGISLFNIDIPDINNDSTTPKQDPSLRGSRNQMRERGYIPALFGRRRIYSDLATQYYTWVEDGKQYLYQLFCCGQKDQLIDKSTIKIAETLLSDYSSTGDINRVLSGSDELLQMKISYGESTTPIITKCVHESQHNSILNHETEDEVDASLIETTVADTEEIHVDIFFPNGLGKYNDKNEIDYAYVDITALYKKEDEPDSQYVPLGHFFGDGDRLILKQLKTSRYSIHKKGLPPGKYTVKITRETEDRKESKIVDKVYVGSIRSIKNESPIAEEKSKLLTLIGLKIRVSEKLNGIVDQLNFESQSILPVPSGDGTSATDWIKQEASSNPASCAIWAMQGPFAQQVMEDTKIDWRAFAKLYDFCKLHNYECNAYLTESMTIQQLLSVIASTCRAEIFRVNGVITVVQDVDRESFVQLFTPRNSWDYEETISFMEIPDAITVSFDNKEVGYASDELTIYNTPNFEKIEEPKEIINIKTWGVTDKDQAKKLAIYKYSVTKNRPIIATFKCDIEYMLCTKGDWIKYAGDIALVGIKQGRVISIKKDDNGNVVSFGTDEIISMEDDKNYFVRVRLADSTSVLLNVITITGNSTQIYLSFPQAINLQEQDLFAFGERDYETYDLIITDISCEENLTATITAVNYAPEIFALDNPDYVLPDFKTNLTEYSGAINNGEINQEGWRTFYTYNDSDETPEIPEGDGTNEGWHRIQTVQSKWVSQKISKSIYTGTWSVPIRTGEAAIAFAEDTRADFERLLIEAQLKGSPIYSIVIDTPVIKKLEGNSYSPPEISCTSNKIEFSDTGIETQASFITNWKVTINNEFVAHYEHKSSIRLNLAELIENIKDKYALSNLELKNIRILCNSINNEAIVWDDEYIPVIASDGGYLLEIENDYQVFECYSKVDGVEYPDGYIKQEKTIKVIPHFYNGLQVLSYGKDWLYSVIPAVDGFRIGVDSSDGTLKITALEGADMATEGSIAIPVFIRSSTNKQIAIGYEQDGVEYNIGFIDDDGNENQIGYIEAEEDSGVVVKSFGYKKLTETAARLAESDTFIEDISKDNKITPPEKKFLSLQFDQVQADYENYRTLYSACVNFRNYEDAYISLKKILYELFYDMTKTSNIDRFLFNNSWTAYYNAKASLENEISQNPVYSKISSVEELSELEPKYGDYILWAGNDEGIFQRGLVYTYYGFGKGWIEDNSPEKMMVAMDDSLSLLANVDDDSIPSVVFCKKLIAMNAVIKNLASQVITLQQNGEIKSTTGNLSIKADGTANFNGTTNIGGNLNVNGNANICGSGYIGSDKAIKFNSDGSVDIGGNARFGMDAQFQGVVKTPKSKEITSTQLMNMTADDLDGYYFRGTDYKYVSYIRDMIMGFLIVDELNVNKISPFMTSPEYVFQNVQGWVNICFTISQKFLDEDGKFGNVVNLKQSTWNYYKGSGNLVIRPIFGDYSVYAINGICCYAESATLRWQIKCLTIDNLDIQVVGTYSNKGAEYVVKRGGTVIVPKTNIDDIALDFRIF